jgi:hypothetical protein
MRAVIERSVVARVGVLVGAAAILALAVVWAMMTPAGHEALVLKLIAWLGPALLLGAVWGWIRYSKRQWMIATSVMVVAMATLFVAGQLLR